MLSEPAEGAGTPLSELLGRYRWVRLILKLCAVNTACFIPALWALGGVAEVSFGGSPSYVTNNHGVITPHSAEVWYAIVCWEIVTAILFLLSAYMLAFIYFREWKRDREQLHYLVAALGLAGLATTFLLSVFVSFF